MSDVLIVLVCLAGVAVYIAGLSWLGRRLRAAREEQTHEPVWFD